MDIPAFAASLLSRADTLLHEWLPDGRQVGNEWVCGSIQGGKGESCKTNLLTGVGADFATGETWGDLLALYATIHKLKQGEAAKQLGWTNGRDLSATASPCQPIPDDPPPLSGPAPSSLYRYGSAFWVARYGTPDGKTFKPWTWRNGKWSAKGYPAPRPLYGLELLDSPKPVLLVEGEKCAEAARTILGRAYNVLTWAGGASSTATVNWEPLYGRALDIWPDADEAGNRATASILERLVPHIVGRVRVLEQDGMPDGWDIADAIADGWDLARLVAHVNRDNGAHIRIIPALTLQKGRPADGVPAVSVIDANPAERSAHSWYEHLNLDKTDRGPYETEDNAARVLARHPQFAGLLWLDEFANKLMYGTSAFDRNAAVAALIYFQQHLAMRKLSLLSIERSAQHVGLMNKRNPVKLWLDSLRWDGIERINMLMSDAFGTVQDEYRAAVGRCWLVSMVARIYEPGCQADYMPVFEGKQGTYKSSAMRILGGEWFTESHSDPIHDRKEFLQGLQGHWLIEVPEMHTISGRGNGIEKIKGIITNRIDSYRVPYGVAVEPFPRQCIFAGTTNHDQWNPDSTGGRRFWPITCGDISLDYLRDNRDQLYAEAVNVYRATHNWYDVPIMDALREQEARREGDVWEEIVLPYAAHKGDVTISDIMEHCLQIPNGQWRQSDQNRIARALRSDGYLRVQLNIGGTRKWAYRKSAVVQRSLEIDEF